VWVKGLPANAARDAFDVAAIGGHFQNVVGGAVNSVVILSNAGAALQLQHHLHRLSQQQRKVRPFASHHSCMPPSATCTLNWGGALVGPVRLRHPPSSQR
jgi:hypothetical protein